MFWELYLKLRRRYYTKYYRFHHRREVLTQYKEYKKYFAKYVRSSGPTRTDLRWYVAEAAGRLLSRKYKFIKYFPADSYSPTKYILFYPDKI